MMSTKWDPDLYLKFQRERALPSVDLVNRIELAAPGTILDLGCGPGNNTAVLAEHWPTSHIIGVDISEEMIDKARTDYPEGEWEVCDARELPANRHYDLVYSNAAIQWVPDHETLIPRLFALVRPGGALAVQVPMREGMPVRRVIETAVRAPRFQRIMSDIGSPIVFHDSSFYYDLLSQAGAAPISLWDTTYYHEMESHEMIVTMMRSTGMRPYLERLAGQAERDILLEEVLQGVRREYPQQSNGRVLYGFHRLFFIAYRRIDG